MSGRLDLKEYDAVAERIRVFYERHPEGAIQTEMVRLEGDLVIFKALVYRAPDDPHPTTGWAYERESGASRGGREADAGAGGAGGAEAARRRVGASVAARFIESCETSAVGRALANLNFAGRRRPSREEMAKVMRMRAAAAGERRGHGPASPPAPRRSGGRAAEAPSIERVRALLETASVSPDRSARIEAKLAERPSARRLHEIEAYLLALQPRPTAGERRSPGRGRAAGRGPRRDR